MTSARPDRAPEGAPGGDPSGDQAGDQVWEVRDPGCQQMVGFRTLVDRRDGSCTVTLDLEPRHLNRQGILHGGMVATLLDVVCGNTASQYFDPETHADLVTVSLNITYVSAARAGETVTARAKPTGGGKSIAYVQGELSGPDGALLASATGIFRRIRK